MKILRLNSQKNNFSVMQAGWCTSCCCCCCCNSAPMSVSLVGGGDSPTPSSPKEHPVELID